MASVIIMRYLNLECEYECRAQRRHVTSAGTTLRHIRTAWGRACPEKLVPAEDEVVLLCTSEGIWWSEVNVSTCLYPDQSLERCAGSRTGARTPTEHCRGTLVHGTWAPDRLVSHIDSFPWHSSEVSDRHLFHLSEAATPKFPDVQLQQGLS